MARKLAFRKSLRQSRLDSLAGQSYYAAMIPDDAKRAEQEQRLAEERAAIKPVRVQAARRPSGKVLERDVLKGIVKALSLHRLVARVERNQSGVFREGERFVRVGSKGKADLTVYLKDGRYAEIEVKSPTGRITDAQWKRVYAIRAAGGLAGIARCVEDAFGIIEG